MSIDRTANLLGALALALTDRMTEETETRAEHGAAAPFSRGEIRSCRKRS